MGRILFLVIIKRFRLKKQTFYDRIVKSQGVLNYMKTEHEKRVSLMTLLYQQDLNPEMPLSLDEEVIDTFLAIQAKKEDVDYVIKHNLTNYTIERLSFVDRAIIRLAVYEMMFTETPKPVVINEAIILTKTFCNLDDEKQSAFTNRLLDNIKKNLG